MNEQQQPLKTLFVLPALEAGGAERVLITLMNGINRHKYAPEFLSVRCDGPLIDLIDSTISTHTLAQQLSPFTLPFLLKTIKRIKPDIIVSTMAHMNFAILALKPFFPHTAFVVREAITPSFLFQKYTKTQGLIKTLYQTLYPKADYVLSPTQKVFDEFANDLNMNTDNFVLLKNPVNVPKIRSAIKLPQPHEHRKKTVHFLACGRLGKQKGFDRLINALETFNLPYAWKLDILGEGQERPFLETLIKAKKLEHKVFLKGLIMPPYSYMAEADCLLMPSRFEGLPNAVLESLACGTPVIATQESGGIDEIAHDCGPGHIRIVKNMQTFIQEMEKIKPKVRKKIAPSLLATCYEQNNILLDFENTLDNLF